MLFRPILSEKAYRGWARFEYLLSLFKQSEMLAKFGKKEKTTPNCFPQYKTFRTVWRQEGNMKASNQTSKMKLKCDENLLRWKLQCTLTYGSYFCPVFQHSYMSTTSWERTEGSTCKHEKNVSDLKPCHTCTLEFLLGKNASFNPPDHWWCSWSATFNWNSS